MSPQGFSKMNLCITRELLGKIVLQETFLSVLIPPGLPLQIVTVGGSLQQLGLADCLTWTKYVASVPSLASAYLHSTERECRDSCYSGSYLLSSATTNEGNPCLLPRPVPSFSPPSLIPHSGRTQRSSSPQRELRKAVFPWTGVSQLFLHLSSKSSLCFCRI